MYGSPKATRNGAARQTKKRMELARGCFKPNVFQKTFNLVQSAEKEDPLDNIKKPDISYQPVAQVRMTVNTGQSKSETLSDPVMMILNRVCRCAYLSEASKSELAEEFIAMPENDKVTLLNHLPSSFDSDNYANRANALFALGLFGPQARFALHGIIGAMDCWNCKVVMQVADTLTNIGASYAVPALLDTLRKAPPPEGTSLQWTINDEYILECLEAFGPAASSAAPALAAYLHFHNSANQALFSIGAAAIPAILNQVQRATESRLDWVRHNAAEIISSIGVDVSQQLVESFASSTPEGRRSLLSMVSLLKPPVLNENAIPWLRQLLTDESLQTYAAEALLNLESGATPDASASDMATVVLKMVHSGLYLSDTSKIELADLLGKAPESEKEKLVAPLCAAMKSGGGGCVRRTNAVYVLGLLGPQAGPAVPAIIGAMKKVSCKGVMQAADALSKIGASYAVPELIKSLNPVPHPNGFGWSRDNECIMVCLGAFEPFLSSDAPFLAMLLGHGSANTLIAGIGPAVIPGVLKEVELHSDQTDMSRTSRFAAEVLSSIGSAASQPLIDALESSTAKPLEAISLVFSLLQPPALSSEAAPALNRLFMSEVTNIRNNAKKALLALGPSAEASTGEFLAEQLTTTPFPTRVGTHPHPVYGASSFIRDGLLKESGLSAIPALTARLSHASPEIQSRAAAWILKISPDNSTAVEKLVSLLGDADEQVRLHALEAAIQTRLGVQSPLPDLMKEKLLPAVMKAWQDRKSAVRRKACEALAVMATEDTMGKVLGGVTAAQSRPASDA
jgi:HEAT repeat protein